MNESIIGICFLLKFWIHEELFYCLVSNKHILQKVIINNNSIISLYFNNELITTNLSINKRYIKNFIDICLDITIIEILEEDNISKDYFLWNEFKIDNIRLVNREIYIPQLSKGNELINIKSVINKIISYEFEYSANIKYSSKGMPIFLENSVNILGIHK